MLRFFSALMIFASLFAISPRVTRADTDNTKSWALYTWVDDDGKWNYSLIRGSEKHPDGSEVKASATQSLEGVKTRLSLLSGGSTVEINPLPVLNMELHLPPSNTLKELERVSNGSKLTLVH